MFAASRAQLVREVIFPAVQDGRSVLCDRFLDSTTVYQGVARQIADDPVTQINSFAVGEVVPDLTVVLDVPAEVGLERIKTGFGHTDRMEQETPNSTAAEGIFILPVVCPTGFSQWTVSGTDTLRS